jgi:hypothetical protein
MTLAMPPRAKRAIVQPKPPLNETIAESALNGFIRRAETDYKERFGSRRGPFLAHSIRTRRGFNPLFWSRTSMCGFTTYLSKMGFHQEVEIDIIDAPESRLHTKEIMLRFKVSENQTHKVATAVRMAHGISAVSRGGPNFKHSEGLDKAIERVYLKLPKKTEVKDLAFIRDVVIETEGHVAWYYRIIGALKALEAKHKRGIKLVLVPLHEPKHLLTNLIRTLSMDEKIIRSGITLRRLARKVSTD